MAILRRYRRMLVILSVIVFGGMAAIYAANRIWPLPLDDIEMSKVVIAKDGSPLWRFADSEGVWRYPIKLDDVSPYYLEALINYEDRWFYQHHGVNPLSIARAAWQNISNGRIVSGGSTISMQVARLLSPHERTMAGKIKQLWHTLQLEWYLSKEEILTLYLNRAPFGGTLEGIGAASWSYLGKPPSELSRSEAALLAVLPQAPSRLRPDRYPERAKVARDKVIVRLMENQVWPESVAKEILEEPIFLPQRQVPQLAPHLAWRVAKEYPAEVIHTTIDVTLQQTLERMAQSLKSRLAPKATLAMLVVSLADLEVKAYVGSLDFNDKNRQGQVDMISAIRSPGSTLKPFVYALAMDEGLIHSESLLQDIPRHFGNYRPSNFDSGFNGPVSVSEALIRSLNLPVVQLIEVYGPKKLTAQLYNAGLRLHFPQGSEPNLALILGGTGVRMDELTAAYTAFARQGRSGRLRFIVDEPLVERQLMSRESAWITRRIMAHEERPLPDELISDYVPIAWKTGTSYGYRDAWAVGVNNQYAIAVWVGRADGTPVVGQFGTLTASPILFQIDNLLAKFSASPSNRGRNYLPDPKPPFVSQQRICWPSGQKMVSEDQNCRQQRYAWVIDGVTPPTLEIQSSNRTSRLWLNYWVNSQGQRVASDCDNAQQRSIALWPEGLEPWLAESERRQNRLPPIDVTCPPFGDALYSPLKILDIKPQTLFKRLPNKSVIDLPISLQGGSGTVWWFLNGELVTQTQDKHNIVQPFTQAGRYQLVVLDEHGQTDKVEFLIE